MTILSGYIFPATSLRCDAASTSPRRITTARCRTFSNWRMETRRAGRGHRPWPGSMSISIRCAACQSERVYAPRSGMNSRGIPPIRMQPSSRSRRAAHVFLVTSSVPTSQRASSKSVVSASNMTSRRALALVSARASKQLTSGARVPAAGGLRDRRGAGDPNLARSALERVLFTCCFPALCRNGLS